MRTKGFASVLVAVGLLAAALPARGQVSVERYADVAEFKARLAGFPVKVVSFDDIGTATRLVVPFAAERYRMKFGMIITGEGGQYASRTFGSRADFVAVSRPNTYAPGPIDWSGRTGWDGGNESDVTFFAWDADIAAAGFGCFFIDADWPLDGPSSLQVYAAGDALLADSGAVVTANGKRAFVGFVTVDSGSGQPVAAITRAHIVNGSGWLGNDNNEGTALDSLMAGTATFKVSGRIVTRSGVPIPGVTVGLDGSFLMTTKTDAQGRYLFRNIPPGTYDVVPSKRGRRFSPAERFVEVIGADLTVPRFIGR